jgi:hypothetical protein
MEICGRTSFKQWLRASDNNNFTLAEPITSFFFLSQSRTTVYLLVAGVEVVVARDHTQWHTHTHTHTNTHTQSVELFWTRGSARRRDIYLTTCHSQETDINIPGGIRTQNPSMRKAADPRLGSRGHGTTANYLFFFLLVTVLDKLYGTK